VFKGLNSLTFLRWPATSLHIQQSVLEQLLPQIFPYKTTYNSDVTQLLKC